MVYGYARVSTLGQARDGNSIEVQVNALQQAGAERIFKDVFSGKTDHRPQLDKLLKVIGSGDKLVITKLDRIARSLIKGIQLLETLSERGVVIEVLNMGVIDKNNAATLVNIRKKREGLEAHRRALIKAGTSEDEEKIKGIDAQLKGLDEEEQRIQQLKQDVLSKKQLLMK